MRDPALDRLKYLDLDRPDYISYWYLIGFEGVETTPNDLRKIRTHEGLFEAYEMGVADRADND